MQVLYFKIMFMQMSDSASVCTEAWKMGNWSILPKLAHFKDFKCIFHSQRTPALVILFRLINKDSNLSC